MKIICSQNVKSHDGNTVIFVKNKEYDIHARVGQLIIVKDETGCIHEIAREKDDKVIIGKQFKDTFSITMEESQLIINN